MANLLKNQKILYGGRYDEGLNYFSPTIVDNPSDHSPLMIEEIFGPILPIIPYNNVKSVVAYIRKKEKPLSVYIFTNNSYFSDYIIHNTSSGSVVVNDALIQASCQDLPFGGGM